MRFSRTYASHSVDGNAENVGTLSPALSDNPREASFNLDFDRDFTHPQSSKFAHWA